MDNLIEARELQIERKHFHVEFRENDRGKFLLTDMQTRNLKKIDIQKLNDFPGGKEQK